MFLGTQPTDNSLTLQVTQKVHADCRIQALHSFHVLRNVSIIHGDLVTTPVKKPVLRVYILIGPDDRAGTLPCSNDTELAKRIVTK